MKYLSFDIECCDGKHICEFGYVIIDEKFNILERVCITINPCHEFKLTGREHERDIALAYPEEIYFNSHTFDYYYDRIKNVLTMSDCKIIGFSLSNDLGFLETAYELYEKEPINFSYCDFQKLYQGYTKAKNRTSIEGFVKELQISDIKLHKSDDDAWAVIRALQIIGEREKLTLPQTLKMLKQRINDYWVERNRECNRVLIEKIKSGNLKAQNKFLKNFIRKLTVSKAQKDDLFFGNSVCISSHFQKNKFNEFLAIIERLYLYGATYTGKASICDIFIEYQDGEEDEIRFVSVKQTIEAECKAIQILSLDAALKALSLTETELISVDYINGKIFNEGKEKKLRKSQSYIDKINQATTIGDILNAKGITIYGFDEVS